MCMAGLAAKEKQRARWSLAEALVRDSAREDEKNKE